MGNDILDKKYNFTIHSDNFLYSNNLTEEMVKEIDEITNKRQIESSTYLKEKKSSKKLSSKNKDDLKKSKKRSSIKSPDDKRSRSKKTRVEGGMPPRGVNVNLPAITEDEEETFDAHYTPDTNQTTLENAYAINYNYHQTLPRDARPIGTENNFRTDSIVSAASLNGVNRSTLAENREDRITAVAGAQWFGTIWRSVVLREHTEHFASFHREGRDYTRERNLDGNNVLPRRGDRGDSIGMRVQELANQNMVGAPPIAARNIRNVNIIYSSRQYRDRDGNVYPLHRTYKILFIISRDIHFTFFCNRFDDGNIEFCSPHFTFEPLDPNWTQRTPEDLPVRLARYHLYASADGFFDGFNRNALRNPIIALSILAHYISKTAYLLLFTDYARRPRDYRINPDYEHMRDALLKYRPDRYDFVELGHYAAGLHIVIKYHFQRQFGGQDLSLFYVHHGRIEFYLGEYHYWLPQILVTRNPALQRDADGGPPRYWGRDTDGGPPRYWGYTAPVFPRDHVAIDRGERGLEQRYRNIWVGPEVTNHYPNYTGAYGDAATTTQQLPRELRQGAHRRWFDRIRGLELGAEAGMDFRPSGDARAFASADGTTREMGAASGSWRRGDARAFASADGEMGAASGSWRRGDARASASANPVRRPGDSNCPNCNALVFASRSECYKCSTPKPNGNGNKGKRKEPKDPGSNKKGKRGGALLNISTNKTLIKYLNKEKELKIDIKLLKKDKNKNKKEIIKKTDLLKKLKLKIIDKKEKLKKQKEKEKEKLKKQKQKEKEKLKKTKRK